MGFLHLYVAEWLRLRRRSPGVPKLRLQSRVHIFGALNAAL